ncbi:3-oxoacyl-[acyl-carrier-protein] synthase III C-terminal domain-containing protein, partial [Singulisphaera rosea]
ANALFADGSAAAVLTGASRPSRPRLAVVASGSTLIEDSTGEMSWAIGDHGFAMTLSTEVPRIISTKVRPWLEGWLRRQGHSLQSIRSWAVHPGGPRILSAFGEAMDILRPDLASSYSVLSQYGNMSSATILFILKDFNDSRAETPAVAIAFGPGLTVEAVLLDQSRMA